MKAACSANLPERSMHEARGSAVVLVNSLRVTEHEATVWSWC